MSEALGLNSEIPEDFEWNSLKYSPPSCTESPKQIKNIGTRAYQSCEWLMNRKRYPYVDHLKRVVSAEKATKDSRAAIPPAGDAPAVDDGDNADENNFEIGVWAPVAEEGPLILPASPDPPEPSKSKGRASTGARNIDEISENIGMGQYSIHNYAGMSDDEADTEHEDYDIFLDFKYTVQEKLACTQL